MTNDRFTRFPATLASQSRTLRFGAVPALLAHPDWTSPAPIVLWMHGRTVNKELDPGRYLRWIRAGIAVCAIDLPGHGDRFDPQWQGPDRTLDLLVQVLHEIDEVIEHLADPEFRGVFDLDRMAIGGMSAGGMAALRRLCDPHPFVCAAVEATSGNLAHLYDPVGGRPWPVKHPPERIAALDPTEHLETWRPIPLLALHTEADQIVPFASMSSFINSLRDHYQERGSDPDLIELLTWPETGAPGEHSGFGRHSNDAKNAQVDFFRRLLFR